MKHEDHELLARTGPDTDMGKLLRRYWVPACLSEEVAEPGGPPLRVRLLSENLVAFRDSRGRLGLMGEHCPHRGASLYLGRNEPGGLRCSYHGWKYGIDGRCVEMPNEPRGEQLKAQICHVAYPCVERAGVVFAYLGPAGTAPEFPQLEWALVPEGHVYVSKRFQECHWTQGMDGDLDPSHVPFLHSSLLPGGHVAREAESWAGNVLADAAPRIDVTRTDYGLLIGSRRDAAEDRYYWRIGQWLMPYYTHIPAWTGDGPVAGHAWVPIDDGCCWSYAWTWHPKRKLTAADLSFMRDRNDGMYSELIPGTYTPKRNRSNGYANPEWADERQPWKRLQYFQDQDVSITESMGSLYDRTRENLQTMDILIVEMRRRLIDAARGLAAGREPPARDPAAFRVRPLSKKISRAAPSWKDAVARAITADPETFVASD